jgi:flagellar biosynthesis GTPase FlhF
MRTVSIGLHRDYYRLAIQAEGVVQRPIITQRSIEVAENRIEPGKSLIIGGMRKSENRSVVRGVPFFKDLPLIGVLFSSKDFEENATEIVFILTPSISSGGVHYTQMAEMIRDKYRTPEYDTRLDDLVSDPLAGDVYTQYVEDKSDRARAETVRFQREAQRADFEAQEERLRAERALLEMQALRVQSEQAQAQYEQAIAQTKASRAQAEAAVKEAEMQKAIISQTEEEIEKASKAAAAAAAEAEKAQAELEAARQKTEAAEQEAQNVKTQQDAIEAEIQKLKQSPEQ